MKREMPRWEVQWMRWRAHVVKAARSAGVPPAAVDTFEMKSREAWLRRPPTSMQKGRKVSPWALVGMDQAWDLVVMARSFAYPGVWAHLVQLAMVETSWVRQSMMVELPWEEGRVTTQSGRLLDSSI